MQNRYPGAFLVSLLLHGGIAASLFLIAYAAAQSRPEATQVFELVEGEGDNFEQTKAPALGEPGAVKLDLPKPLPPAPEPAPNPQEVAAPEPAPVAPAPAPPPPVVEKPVAKAPQEKPVEKPKDIAKAIEKQINRADT